MPPLTSTFTQRIPECFPYQNLSGSIAHTRRVNQETLTAAGGDVLTGCCETCGDIVVIHPTSPPINPAVGPYNTTYGQRENGLVQDLFRTTSSPPHEFLSPTFQIACGVGYFSGNTTGTITPTGPGTFTGSGSGFLSGAVAGPFTFTLSGTGDLSSGTYTGSVSGTITGTFSGSYPPTGDPLLPNTIYDITSPDLGGAVLVGRSSVSGFTFTGNVRLVQRCYERLTWSSCNRGGMVLEVFRHADDVLLFRYTNQHHGVRSMADALLLLDYFNCEACFDNFTQALCAQTWTFDAVGIP